MLINMRGNFIISSCLVKNDLNIMIPMALQMI